MSRRPPKYVNGFIDRHGRPRYYLRRPAFKSVPLPGSPWSPEFMAAYQAALVDQPRVDVVANHARPGTMRALAISYMASSAYNDMAENSRVCYRRIIERFCKQQDTTGHEFGEKSAVAIERRHIVKIIEVYAGKRQYANYLLKVLRALMRHAIAISLREDDPTANVRPMKVRTEGFHSWSEEEIAAFEARHPIGSQARLALALLLYSGQRRSDVTKLGPQHIQGGALHVRQTKTGAAVAVPIHPALREAIDASATGHLSLLVSRGQPMKPATFSAMFRQACRAAGLPHCSAHGLRKAAARRLAEAGCTPHEIAAITGHRSLNEIARYTRAVEQRRLADAAIEKLKGER
jgi:integrase